MDINTLLTSIKEIYPYLNMALGTWKQLKDVLPEGTKKIEAIEALETLEKVERQLKLTETQIMLGLGYELCRNHEIPEIMLSKDDQNWECPRCKNKKYTGVEVGPSPFQDYRG